MELKDLLNEFEIPHMDAHHTQIAHDNANNIDAKVNDNDMYYDSTHAKEAPFDKDMFLIGSTQIEKENFKLYDLNHDGKLDKQDLIAFVEREAKRQGVPISVVKGIINQESRWNPDALGKNATSQDIGLMQLNSRYVKDFENRFWKHDNIDFDPKNPFHNAEVGIAHLRSVHKELGGDAADKQWEKSIMAYNAGVGAVKSGKIPKGSRQYLSAIIRMINNKDYGIG